MGVVVEVAIGSFFLIALMAYIEKNNTDRLCLNIISGILTVFFILFAYVIGHIVLNLILS
jgi:hypothetical protein